MQQLSDYQARHDALTIQKSFIVQAPAGSGKTELLTQRYLALLGTACQQPEEILAITFTRKAAAEMRLRILHALNKARTEPEPVEPHAKKTYQLSIKVLAQSEKLSWNLLDNPHRLRIQTIDSFCNYIIKQMPIISRFGCDATIQEDANEFYNLAADRTLELLETSTQWANAIECLLIHLDNNLEKLHELFINMLKCRDQWLSHVMNPNPREYLEAALQHVNIEHLHKLAELIPEHLQDELYEIIKFSKSNLPVPVIARSEELASLLTTINTWIFIAEILLTNEDQFRKSFTIKQGFPAPSAALSDEQKKIYSEMKLKAQQLCENFSKITELKETLAEVRLLPNPHYTDAQWQMLEALIMILPVLSAQLQIVFTEKKRVDFIEVAIRALHALGNQHDTSDLALQFDYKLRHILVDEFQDTSTLQFKLVEKLTTEWQKNDAKTIFFVGDPQQSIYRFRKAEVGLFIQTQKNGIANIQVQPLHLTTNFRSNANLINWNNQLFSKTFPLKDNYLTGAVTFKMAQANKTSDVNVDAVHIHCMRDEKTESKKIIEIIKKSWEKNVNYSIAILVMARSHVTDVIAELQKNNIPYRAVEIESLVQKEVIQDLYSLTRALIFPADRLAWLAILRAPWCGLRLHELEIIADTQRHETILERIQQYESLSLLPETKMRLQLFLAKINNAINMRGKFSLHTIIHTTWLSLGTPIKNSADLADVKQYLDLLAEFEHGSDINDFALFEHHLERLNAKEHETASQAVEIMTIHKAKGLEFDVVILPALHKKTMSDPHQLLLWQEKPTSDGNFELLLAPIHSSLNSFMPKKSNQNKIYDYLRFQEQKKIKNELNRLLYVALTRAKEELHLLSTLSINNNEIKKPIKGSLLFVIWDFISSVIARSESSLLAMTEKDSLLAMTGTVTKNKLFRRKITEKQTDFISLEKAEKSIIKVHNKNLLAQHIGTVIHELFKKIDQTKMINQLLHYAKFLLIHHAIPLQELERAMTTCHAAIKNILSDNKGRWILANHSQSQAELAINAVIDNKLHYLIIDKTFVVDDTRWIIDFKTTQNYDVAIEDFFQQQKALYQEQLETYAKALALIEKREIKLGLYFPLIPAWHEWNYMR